MPAQWGRYERKDFDRNGDLVETTQVVLPADEIARAVYEAKKQPETRDPASARAYATFTYLGDALAPGMEDNVPDVVVHARALEDAAKAAKAAEKEHEATVAAHDRAQRRAERATAGAPTGGEASAVRAAERGEPPPATPPVPAAAPKEEKK